MMDARSAKTPRGSAAIAPVDIAAMLWRERTTALIVLCLVVALGAVAAALQPKTYRAESRILVRLGQEYVFQPSVGAAGAGAAPRSEEMLNSELKLLQSPEVARSVVDRIGLGKLFPALARAPLSPEMRESRAEAAFFDSFRAWTSPNTPILSVSFEHKDPALAAQTLNTAVEAYLAYRREVLAPASAGLEEQSRTFEERAAAATTAVQALLRKHGVGDFDGEQRSLIDLQAKIDSEIAEAEARRREFESRAAALRARVGAQDETINLSSESDAAKTLTELRLEREQLLARYKPDAPPVAEIDRRIAGVERLLDAGLPATMTKRGPNPVRQELERLLFEAEADARAQAGRAAALTRQRAAAATRLQALRDIEPAYRALEREQAVLAENARAFTSRAEEARALSALAARASDTIRQMEPARPPARGQSLRFEIMLAAAFVGAGLGAVAAIARGLARDRFPTASSAARILEQDLLDVARSSRRSAA